MKLTRFLILSSVFCLLSSAAPAARLTLTITVTNAPTALSNATYTINGNLRSWSTNGTPQITNSTAQAATNIYNNALAGGLGGGLVFSIATNTFKITGSEGAALTGTLTGSFGIMTITTNVTAAGHSVIVPWSTQPAGNATNDANEIIAYINIGTGTIAIARLPAGVGQNSFATNSTFAGTATNALNFGGATAATWSNLINSIRLDLAGGTNLAIARGNLPAITATNTSVNGYLNTNGWNFAGTGSFTFTAAGNGSTQTITNNGTLNFDSIYWGQLGGFQWSHEAANLSAGKALVVNDGGAVGQTNILEYLGSQLVTNNLILINGTSTQYFYGVTAP